MMIGTKGLFCGNFCTKYRGDDLCRSAWCGKCYRTLPDDRFHISYPQDTSGFIHMNKVDTLRFKEARNADHIMCNFQCDFCIFYMMKNRAPITRNMKDKLLMTCLRRANLDAMWAREPSTVHAYRREVNRAIKISELVGMDPGFRPLGPYRDEDIQGMTVAVQMLLRSLDPGKYADYSQFETILKF